MTNEHDPTESTPEGSSSLEKIGPYHLLRRVGEGGMGEVWLAEQREPIRRQVALKVIKQGMDTRQVVARFEAERQALAMMDHPAIAQIYDAGATPYGRPYFVMEYVKGIPINEHCDQNRLTSRERLSVFMQVCEGVQHAHQKAVIHRDLKPSNVLVTVRENSAQPKIIDFGVAKATAQKLTEQTMYTQLGALIGTPSYMSPEQADLTLQDVDTRTDVYSLGVILYELLVGALPFDMHELRTAGVEAMLRKLRDEEPERPSTRVDSAKEESTQTAKNRGTSPLALKRELAGDLDWIALKALEKDRTRRYRSPQELADDIQRFLRDEPVVARPPSTAYRFRKFVRRHRAGVTIGALVALAMVVAIAGLGIGLQRARKAEQRALEAEAAAVQEAEISQRVTEFMAEMFRFSTPADAASREMTARELLDAGAERVREGLADTPLVRASLMDTIGEVYTNLGEYEAAESLLMEALATREAELGPDHLDVAESANNVGVFFAQTGRFADAMPMFQRALEIRESQLGPVHLEVAQSLSNVAIAVRRLGNHEEAIPLAQRSLSIREELTGPNSKETSESLGNLANIYFEIGRYKEALEMYERGYQIDVSRYGPRHTNVGIALVNLGNAQTLLDDLESARASFEACLDIWSETLDPGHPYIPYALNNLGELLLDLNEPEQARETFQQAIDLRESSLGPNHPDVAYPVVGLATTEHRLGNLERSKMLFERARSIREAALGRDHPEMLVILDEYAEVLDAIGQQRSAELVREQAEGIRNGSALD